MNCYYTSNTTQKLQMKCNEKNCKMKWKRGMIHDPHISLGRVMNNYVHSSFLPIEKNLSAKFMNCEKYFVLVDLQWDNLKKMPGDFQNDFVKLRILSDSYALWSVTHLKVNGFKFAKVWTL